MRLLLFALLAVAFPVLGQQQAPSDNRTTVVSNTTASSTIRIAEPNENVVINGHVLRVADLLAVLSSLDSLEGQRLHSPEKQNRETPQPNAPSPKQDPKNCSAGSPQHPSCVEVESKPQDQKTKPRPE